MRRSGPGRVSCVVVSVCLAAAAGLRAQRDPLPFSRSDADHLTQKVAAIVEQGGVPRRAGTPVPSRRTVIRESEVNAYLRYISRDQLPVGFVDPYVIALGNGRLLGRAQIDLDAVRRVRERSLLDPMRYLSGRVPVTASGILRTRDGSGWFELEAAAASGMRIPAAILQEVVTFYSRTAANPGGFTLDAPFVLPAGIREIEVRAGQAVIIQ